MAETAWVQLIILLDKLTTNSFVPLKKSDSLKVLCSCALSYRDHATLPVIVFSILGVLQYYPVQQLLTIQFYHKAGTCTLLAIGGQPKVNFLKSFFICYVIT